MRLGELLVGQGLVTAEEVEVALQRQQQQGGRLGNHLVAMGAITVDQMLTALSGQKEVGATLDMCARTFQRWQAIHGPNHPNTHRARYCYARALLDAGRAAEAVTHTEVALAGYWASIGKHHPWTNEAVRLLANARRAATANQPQQAATASVA
jgi:hypothetical protein